MSLSLSNETGASVAPLPPASWHLLGGGSVGGLLACHLRRAGISARLILRDEASVAAAKVAGITLREGETTTRFDDLDLTAPAGIAEPIKRLIICTKAQQSEAAVDAIADHLAPAPLLVLMQNGMGVRERLLARWPGATVIHGITTEGVFQPERFRFVHAGRGETLVGAAVAEDRAGAAAAQQVAQLLTQAGLSARAVEDCQARLWQKLAVNCVLNPLTALCNCRNGELLARAEVLPWVDGLCHETAAVATAAGVPFTAAELRRVFDRVAEVTAANHSSMLQDYRNGRATEIDFINGYVVALADRYGIPVPLQRSLLEAIRARRDDLPPLPAR